jgi:hypothetical protein
VSTNLQRFIRSAVEPGPTTNGVPNPAFVTGAITPTSMTFYTNVGDPYGPAEIVAKCQSTTPSSGLCNAGGIFTVTEAHATANSSTGSTNCPPTGTGCTWGTPETLIKVLGVSNASDNAPLFLYTLLQTTASSSGTTSTTSQIGSECSSQHTGSAVLACDYSDDTAAFNTCTSTHSTSGNVLASCQSAEIYAVTIDLQVNGVSTGRLAGGQSEDDSTVYLLSPESADYEPMVG